MNVREVAGLLAYFGSAWPKTDLPDDTADVWAMELVDVDPDHGREAAKNLVRTMTFFPSIAEFLEECRQVGLHRRATESFKALPAPEQHRELPTDLIAELRSKLTDWSTKGHNHKGPEPCPTCGGNAA